MAGRAVTINLDGEEYKLRLTINSLADLEENFGLGFTELFSEKRLGLSSIRALLWAAMRTEYPMMTKEFVGELLQAEFDRDPEHGFDKIAEKMQQVMVASGLAREAAEEEAEEEEGKVSPILNSSAASANS